MPIPVIDDARVQERAGLLLQALSSRKSKVSHNDLLPLLPSREVSHALRRFLELDLIDGEVVGPFVDNIAIKEGFVPYLQSLRKEIENHIHRQEELHVQKEQTRYNRVIALTGAVLALSAAYPILAIIIPDFAKEPAFLIPLALILAGAMVYFIVFLVVSFVRKPIV